MTLDADTYLNGLSMDIRQNIEVVDRTNDLFNKENLAKSVEYGTCFVARDNPKLSHQFSLAINDAIQITRDKIVGPSSKVRTEKADDFALCMGDVIKDLRNGGHSSYQAVADALNARGYKSARNGHWSPSSVFELEKRYHTLQNKPE